MVACPHNCIQFSHMELFYLFIYFGEDEHILYHVKCAFIDCCYFILGQIVMHGVILVTEWSVLLGVPYLA